MATFTGSLVHHPARVSVAWYGATITLGALALWQPFCQTPLRPPVSLLDCYFTATSATCVTGLAVRSTGQDFSFWGQVVILLLIQLGGIGIMTVTTFVTFYLGGQQSLRHRAVLSETLGARGTADLRSVLRGVILWAMAIECLGTGLLFLRFWQDFPVGTALWHAVFHAVSAFCNAGFGLADENLVGYQGDVLVNLTVISLIVTGGIGFPVLLDISRVWRSERNQLWERLMLHSKIMLLGTAALLVGGTAAFLVLEWHGVLADMSLPRRLLVALFHSTTCRTAGFNTVDVGRLTSATLFLSILLMMVGTGPCSTGGGFKVSTLAVLVLRGWRTLGGHRLVAAFRRTVPETAVDRAMTVAMLYSVVAVAGLTVLLVCEQSAERHPLSQGLFLDAAFESVSALGTVGLTTGITPYLSRMGRVVIILLMFIGRLGPISVFIALARRQRDQVLEHAPEEPLIG